MKDAYITMAIPKSRFFPDPELTDEDGLLFIGGELAPDIVLDALVHGIFPWPVMTTEEDYFFDNETQERTSEELNVGESNYGYAQNCLNSEKNVDLNSFAELSPRVRNAIWEGKTAFSLLSLPEANSTLAWWSPDPRAVFDLDNIHIPRRLKRTMSGKKFVVTYDQAFPEVMIACATSENRDVEGTWITREFYNSYCRLHELGFAHSVECWQETIDERLDSSGNQTKRKLVGGLYGVALNGFFDGESMFSVVTDASKIALFSLLLRLKEKGFRLFDLQILNPHTKSLGGIEIPRSDYLARLQNALETRVRF